MQRIVVFKQPYGAAFRLSHSLPGHPHDLFLVYDSCQDRAIVDWLKKTLAEHEAYLAALPAPPDEPTEITVAPVAANVLKQIVSMTASQHDWGQPYRLGLTCSRCQQVADGFEGPCGKRPEGL